MNSNGMSLFGVLGVVFIVLKLIGVISWSWWLVTLPFWGGIALLGVFVALYSLWFVINEKRKK
jgi:hypothetical protein